MKLSVIFLLFFLGAFHCATVHAQTTPETKMCPDLTSIVTILPSVFASISQIQIAIEVSELNGTATNGSSIIVRIPFDSRITFINNPPLPSTSNWAYQGNNGLVHYFFYKGGIFPAGTTDAFLLNTLYDPQNTDGHTSISSSVVPFSGGECNVQNNSDSEWVVYYD